MTWEAWFMVTVSCRAGRTALWIGWGAGIVQSDRSAAAPVHRKEIVASRLSPIGKGRRGRCISIRAFGPKTLSRDQVDRRFELGFLFAHILSQRNPKRGPSRVVHGMVKPVCLN